MKRIIIFAGTTEGRLLSDGLAKGGVPHILSVATDYGELVLKENPLVQVHKGRMNEDEMESFIEENGDLVFDATHPYASIVTDNIKEACNKKGKEYIRIIREKAAASQDNRLNPSEKNGEGKVVYFEDVESCAKGLLSTAGNILLTTGSKDIDAFASDEEVRERLYARVLPSVDSIELCNNAGLKGEHIIAMQGPFSLELNKALISQLDIKTLVTKESGVTGGFPEKLKAADDEGIDLFVIGRPREEKGLSVKEAIRLIVGEPVMEISLVGIGPGDLSYLTERSRAVIETSDVVFGAERMIAPYKETKEAYPYYLAKDVVPILLEGRPERVAILFSGDSGFYSGSEKMRREVEDLLAKEGIKCRMETLPGISSLSYFSAKIGESYSNSGMISLHGKSKEPCAYQDFIHELETKGRIFSLLSGKDDVEKLCNELIDNNLGDIPIVFGYELSYEDERIFHGTPKSILKDTVPTLRSGLFTVFAKK